MDAEIGEMREILKENLDSFRKNDPLLNSRNSKLPSFISVHPSFSNAQIWHQIKNLNNISLKNLDDDFDSEWPTFDFANSDSKEKSEAKNEGIIDESDAVENESDFLEEFSDTEQEENEISDDKSDKSDANSEIESDKNSILSNENESKDQNVVIDDQWAMKGEVMSKERPIGSLVNEDLEFVYSKKITKPSKELTDQLEALVKQRILDQVFDNVIRRKDTGEKIKNIYQNQFMLDHEQSKKTLDEVYICYSNGSEPKQLSEPSTKHAEIEKTMEKLFEDLDLMCRFNLKSNLFQSKPGDTKISVGIADKALESENILPLSAAVNPESNTLAPEEVSKLKYKSEDKIGLTVNKERKREKRIIKLKVKAKNNEQLRKFKEKNPHVPIKTAKENLKMIKKPKTNTRYFNQSPTVGQGQKMSTKFFKEMQK